MVNGRRFCAGSSLPLGGARYPCVCESCVCAHVPAATTRHLRDCGQLSGLAIFVAPTMVDMAVPAPNPTSHARPRRPGLADFGPRASDQLDRCHHCLGYPSGIDNAPHRPRGTLSPVSVTGQKRYRILPSERPVWRRFWIVTQPWPQVYPFRPCGSSTALPAKSDFE